MSDDVTYVSRMSDDVTYVSHMSDDVTYVSHTWNRSDKRGLEIRV